MLPCTQWDLQAFEVLADPSSSETTGPQGTSLDWEFEEGNVLVPFQTCSFQHLAALQETGAAGIAVAAASFAAGGLAVARTAVEPALHHCQTDWKLEHWDLTSEWKWLDWKCLEQILHRLQWDFQWLFELSALLVSL